MNNDDDNDHTINFSDSTSVAVFQRSVAVEIREHNYEGAYDIRLSLSTENQSSKRHGDQCQCKSRCCTQGHLGNGSSKRSKLQCHSKGHIQRKGGGPGRTFLLKEHPWRCCWMNFRQTTFSMLTTATIKVELSIFSLHQAYAFDLHENFSMS